MTRQARRPPLPRMVQTALADMGWEPGALVTYVAEQRQVYSASGAARTGRSGADFTWFLDLKLSCGRSVAKAIVAWVDAIGYADALDKAPRIPAPGGQEPAFNHPEADLSPAPGLAIRQEPFDAIPPPADPGRVGLMLRLSARDRATVVAALRCYVADGMDMATRRPLWVSKLATGGGKVQPMDADEIDGLCDRLAA